jgi:hypothetical protein
VLSSLTAVYWIAADRSGLLRPPEPEGAEAEEIELRQEAPA